MPEVLSVLGPIDSASKVSESDTALILDIPLTKKVKIELIL